MYLKNNDSLEYWTIAEYLLMNLKIEVKGRWLVWLQVILIKTLVANRGFFVVFAKDICKSWKVSLFYLVKRTITKQNRNCLLYSIEMSGLVKKINNAGLEMVDSSFRLFEGRARFTNLNIVSFNHKELQQLCVAYTSIKPNRFILWLVYGIAKSASKCPVLQIHPFYRFKLNFVLILG